jgi:Ca-activated chloride channel homolog
MTWAHPVVLALVPVALPAAWWLCRFVRGGDALSFVNIRRLWADRRGLSPDAAPRTRRVLRGVFLAAGAAAALLALARPQWGRIAEQSYDQSREVVLALDLSRSMLADDVAPSRLARAKLLIGSLLDELQGERVGLIVFAGTSFVQSPLSPDYEVLRDFLDELDPSYLPQGGTDYEHMLRTAVQAFGQQGGGDRYLVVLSDGEALDPNWRELVPSLRARGIRVIGLGVGTPDGALVPDGKGGLVKDEHGAAVLSRLEPRTLQELAAETAGTYRDAASWVDIAELVNATVEQGQRGNYVEERHVRLQNRYQWFLAPAVFFLLLSYWLEFPLSPLARALPTRGRRPHPASAPAIAAALLALAAWQTPRLASAAVPDTPPSLSGTASQPNPLTTTVAELSAKPAPAPADYARMASETITFARDPKAPQDSARTGVIDDALAAVDRGEAGDPRAADWPTLRQQLEQLKHAQPQPPPQDEQNQQPPDQQQNQQDAGSAGGSPDDSENRTADQQQGAGQESADQPDESGAGKEPQNQASHGSESDQQQAGSDADQPDTGRAASDGPQPPADQRAGQDDHRPAGDHGAGTSEPQQDDQQVGAGEVQRQEETQPLDAPEAGLAGQDDTPAEKDREEAQAAPPAAPEPAAEQPKTRLVGGGRALASAEPQGDSALAQALGTMEHVKDGDAPAVLFDRMNRAEGQPRAVQNGKNW